MSRRWSKELGVTIRTVYAILDAGDIACYRIRRVIRIKRADLDDYLERVKVQPGELRNLYQQAKQEPGDGGSLALAETVR